MNLMLIAVGMTMFVILFRRRRKVKLLHNEFMSKSWMRENVYRSGQQ